MSPKLQFTNTNGGPCSPSQTPIATAIYSAKKHYTDENKQALVAQLAELKAKDIRGQHGGAVGVEAGLLGQGYHGAEQVDQRC
jgi:hypothetical protein